MAVFEEEVLTVQEEELFGKLEWILLYSICGFGAPANMISFFILSRPQMKSPINCCLQFLAAFDTLYLVSWFFIVNNVAKRYFGLISYIALTGSVWTVVLVSLERFVAVCHPLKARSIFTYRRTVLCGLSITVCATCMNVPRLFLLDNGRIIGMETDSLIYFITRYSLENYNLLTKREIYIAKIYGWFEVSVVFCVPLILLSFFNIYIFMAVKKSLKARREMTPSQKSEVKLSKTVIAIVIVFFISGIQIVIFKSGCYSGAIPYQLFYKTIVFVTPILSVNSAANFVIYFALRPDFRGIIFGIFSHFCCRRKEPEGNIITTRL